MWAAPQPLGRRSVTSWTVPTELAVASGKTHKTVVRAGDGPFAVTLVEEALSVRAATDLHKSLAVDPLAAFGAVTARINVVRCLYVAPVFYVFCLYQTSAGAAALRILAFQDGQLSVLLPELLLAAPADDILFHPSAKTKFILCRVNEIVTYDLADLYAPPDVTDLLPYLRLIKYFHPDAPTAAHCKAAITGNADHAYVAVWVVGTSCVAILTDSWIIKKFRLEGVLEITPRYQEDAYTDLKFVAGGKSELPESLWTLTNASRLKPVAVSSNGEVVTRLLIVVTSARSLLSIPLYVTKIDLLNAVAYGDTEHEINFGEDVRVVGSTKSAVLLAAPHPGKSGKRQGALMHYAPGASKLSAVGMHDVPVIAWQEKEHLVVAGSLWMSTIPAADAVPGSKAPEQPTAVGAASPEPPAHPPAAVLASPTRENTQLPRAQRNPPPATAPNLAPAIASPDSLPMATPSNPTVDVKVLRANLTNQFDKLKFELFVSMESQLAKVEASLMQRFQAHSDLHMQKSLNDALEQMEKRMIRRHEELLEAVNHLSAAVSQSNGAAGTGVSGRSAAVPSKRAVNEAASRGPHNDVNGEESFPMLGPETCGDSDFAERFCLDSIVRAYAEDEGDEDSEYSRTRALVTNLKSSITTLDYDKALFNAAHADVKSGTKGFWTVVVSREFEAKDLLGFKSRTIAMAAVRMLSESLDNWDGLLLTPENLRHCVRAVWNNEIVRVPLVVVTKQYHTVEERLRWIHNGMGVAQTNVELSETEVRTMLKMLRTKVNNLKEHLQTAESVPLADNARNRCVLMAELVDSTFKTDKN